MVELRLSDGGLRPAVVHWGEVTGHIVHRARNELFAGPLLDDADRAPPCGGG